MMVKTVLKSEPEVNELFSIENGELLEKWHSTPFNTVVISRKVQSSSVGRGEVLFTQT